MNRIVTLVAIAGAALTLDATPPAPQEHPSPKPQAAASAPAAPGDLFSKRALRRARLIIQMRMLELREERLECVRAAILRRLPPDLQPGRTGESAKGVKQSSAPSATTPRSAISKSEDCGWLSTQPKRRRRTA
jgi:hypothetical protein